jgi:type I restriction enzyme, S subunit
MTGWRTARLGDLVKVVGGGTPTRSNPDYYGGDIPWVTPKDMKSWIINGAQVAITQTGLDKSAARLVPANSVLIVVRSGVLKHTVPVGLNRVPVAINQDMKALLCSDRVDPEFLGRLIKARSSEILSWVRATTADNFPIDKLKDLEITLPSLEEQRRIVEMLERADELRTKRCQALARLDDLTKSVFLDMFGHPAINPLRWEESTIEAVAEQVTDGEHLTPMRAPSGVMLLSARNVRDGYLDFGNVDYVPQKEYERIRRRCNPVRGDILISCSGTIGRVAAVRTGVPLALVRSVALVRPSKDVLRTDYLENYLRTQALKDRMMRDAKSSSQANLFQGPIRQLPVLLPPLELQDEFSFRLAMTDKLKADYRASLADLDALFASLQDRAFRGLL